MKEEDSSADTSSDSESTSTTSTRTAPHGRHSGSRPTRGSARTEAPVPPLITRAAARKAALAAPQTVRPASPAIFRGAPRSAAQASHRAASIAPPQAATSASLSSGSPVVPRAVVRASYWDFILRPSGSAPPAPPLADNAAPLQATTIASSQPSTAASPSSESPAVPAFSWVFDPPPSGSATPDSARVVTSPPPQAAITTEHGTMDEPVVQLAEEALQSINRCISGLDTLSMIHYAQYEAARRK